MPYPATPSYTTSRDSTLLELHRFLSRRDHPTQKASAATADYPERAATLHSQTARHDNNPQPYPDNRAPQIMSHLAPLLHEALGLSLVGPSERQGSRVRHRVVLVPGVVVRGRGSENRAGFGDWRGGCRPDRWNACVVVSVG